ncbi:hypothetical protein HPB50_010733 [Hyalomma asiaticum]|uniref:Uncharacterized protein n=1 Tax=Hyalomma asiaticum TaxID=266040 RepID=A0ACB7RIK4_HYAAI|nr:hypothetical protein HPB50_010733 [Hyalomma asiaticum]
MNEERANAQVAQKEPPEASGRPTSRECSCSCSRSHFRQLGSSQQRRSCSKRPQMHFSSGGGAHSWADKVESKEKGPALLSRSSSSVEQYRAVESIRGRLYSCQHCAYLTKDKAHMKRHLNTHTGERPYRCHLCPAAFTQGCHLRVHVRAHTGERPYRCAQCDASFSQKTYLGRHMRTHRGGRPFR